MAAAERYAQARSGTITFAVVDEAGRLHGYQAHAVAPSASVLKAMLLVAYLRRRDVRGRDLEQWERDLLRPMIKRSDNAAASRGRIGPHLDRVASGRGAARRAAARESHLLGGGQRRQIPSLDPSPSSGRLSFSACGGSSFGTKRRAWTPSSSSTTTSFRFRPAGRGCCRTWTPARWRAWPAR
jgi:hypothetical protein